MGNYHDMIEKLFCLAGGTLHSDHKHTSHQHNYHPTHTHTHTASCLKIDPKQRLSCEQLLAHPFLARFSELHAIDREPGMAMSPAR
jgi:hypothetical protein